MTNDLEWKIGEKELSSTTVLREYLRKEELGRERTEKSLLKDTINEKIASSVRGEKDEDALEKL